MQLFRVNVHRLPYRTNISRFYRLEKRNAPKSPLKRSDSERLTFIDTQTAEQQILEHKSDYVKCMDVYKQLVNKNSIYTPNETIIKTLVQTCMAHNDQTLFKQVLQLYDDVARFNINIDSITLERISVACVRVNEPETVSLSMYQELQPEQETYSLLRNLLLANAKSDRVEVAFAIFKKIIAHGWRLASGTVTSLIQLAVRKENLELCMQVFEHAKQNNIALSNAPFSNLIKLCHKLKAQKEGARVIEYFLSQKFHFENYSWNRIISFYAHCGELNRSLSSMQKAIGTGVSITSETITTVLKSVLKNNSYSFGRRVHTLMNENKYEFLPVHYALLIFIYEKLEQIDPAVTLYDQMIDKQIPVSNQVYTALFNLCVLTQNSQTGGRIYETMMKSKNVPDVETYQSIMIFLYVLEQKKMAMDIYDSIKSTGMLDLEKHVKLLRRCAELNLFGIGTTIYNDLKSSGAMNAQQSWNSFATYLKLLANNDQVAKAITFLEETKLERVDLYPDSILLEIISQRGTLEQFNRMRDVIAQSGMKLDPATVTALLKCFIKFDMLEEAMELFDTSPKTQSSYSTLYSAFRDQKFKKYGNIVYNRMVQDRYVAKYELYEKLVDMLLEYEQYGDVVDVFVFAEKYWDLKPKMVTYSRILTKFVEEKQHKLVDRLIPLMLKRSNELTVFEYTTMMRHSFATDNITMVMNLFEKTLENKKSPDSVMYDILFLGFAQKYDVTNGEVVWKHLTSSNFKIDQTSIFGVLKWLSAVGKTEEAVKVFYESNSRHNKEIIAIVARMCTTHKLVDQGKNLFDETPKRLLADSEVQSSFIPLVAMWDINKASEIFEQYPKSVFTWGAMIKAYGDARDGKIALELFNRMKREGVKQTAMCTKNVIGACYGSGMYQEAIDVYEQKTVATDVKMDTTASLAYAQAGQVEKAIQLAEKVNNIRSWMGVLRASVANKQVDQAQMAAQRVFAQKSDHYEAKESMQQLVL